jgi:hypothetical protein
MFDDGDVIIIHLTSGQDLVAKLIAQEEGGLIIEAPTYLMVREDKNKGDIAVGYAHYLTPERIAQVYIRATSGIQIATAMPSLLSRS